jgi:hypothetical protein
MVNIPHLDDCSISPNTGQTHRSGCLEPATRRAETPIAKSEVSTEGLRVVPDQKHRAVGIAHNWMAVGGGEFRDLIGVGPAHNGQLDFSAVVLGTSRAGACGNDLDVAGSLRFV